jgi:hypothetical protein
MPETRTIKNSSRFEEKTERNFSRSSGGVGRFFQDPPKELELLEILIKNGPCEEVLGL